MKNTLIALLLVVTGTLPAFATGPSISGGVPPAPRAVIIQIRVQDNQFDQRGRFKVLRQIAVDKKNKLILNLSENGDATRKQICIEYTSFDVFSDASERFQVLLQNHKTMSVVRGSFCRP